MNVTISINGEKVTREIEPRQLLVHFIRETPGLTGTHWGCDTSNCGACVVQMDGEPVKSCTILAAMCEGHEIRTVESLEVDGQLDPVQMGFHEQHALQCGFCTPGMLISATALLAANPDPSEEEIRIGLSGNLCRCTGYDGIVKAVRSVAEGEVSPEPVAGTHLDDTHHPHHAG
jgi:aerobic carbon-monoxide dehydrogenase small subunit